MDAKRTLSFVIPARNEAASLAILVREIQDVCRWHDFGHEVILVDDGSTDGTWAEISRLASVHSEIRGIRLRRNYGKGPAMDAGFRQARGEIIFTLDADLQDNPEDVPRFVELLNQGMDVVVGWRKTRQDTWFKRAQSKLFNSAVSITGLRLHDHNCGMKAFRADALEDIRLYGDMHRYLPILFHINGWKVGEVEVRHRSRIHGRSNYGLGRTYRGFFDLVTILVLKSFRYRPMHLLGPFGATFLLAGAVGLGYLALLWLLGKGIGGRPLLIYSFASLVFGGQVIATGILAELLTAYMARYENLYAVRETSNALAENEIVRPLLRTPIVDVVAPPSSII